MSTVYYGAVINPISLTSYQALPRCLLIVSSAGEVDWILDNVEESDLQEKLASLGLVDVEVVALKDGEFLLPGFIDTHTVSLPCVSRITFIWCAFCSLLCSLACSAGDQYWQVWIIFM